MTNQTSGKELVSAGHAFAKAISMDTPLIVIAKMVSDLSTRLDCAIARGNALQQERDALAAENAILKSGIGFFSYGTDSGFEEHDSAEEAIAAADSDIDYYRGDACDGWSEETDCTVWGVILQRATMIDERPRTEEDSYLGSHISSVCDYALLPNLTTSATDAFLNSVRADALESFAHQQRVIADALPGHEEQRSNRITACRAEDFAKQLRAPKGDSDE
ncbi:hypothetical protein LU196_13020 [Pantoea sp. Mb-10]|uniref:hypothetical protein n=1 Tax=unclassified Pantoea TaxID=2630326 RepID=UPI001E4A0438|nr:MULTISPECIES: hypothetical protein [unclassified Pantoea]MCE0490961.1 hypothetical protein [Pantoea sp. Mb-10]MCE0499881.1 hypothetical protein [Pantoea sp. Pb-8]